MILLWLLMLRGIGIELRSHVDSVDDPGTFRRPTRRSQDAMKTLSVWATAVALCATLAGPLGLGGLAGCGNDGKAEMAKSGSFAELRTIKGEVDQAALAELLKGKA